MPGLAYPALTQPLDANSEVIPWALAYFYEAGTTTPKTPYAEYSLATPLTNPVEADGNGMFPPIYLDDSDSIFYRFRITDANGVVYRDLTQLPIPGSSSGGGSPPEPVPAYSLLRTGQIIMEEYPSEVPGFLLLNGKTLGNPSSGADYANNDALALWSYYWPRTELAISGGARGASALADWNANRRLTRPDWRGYTLVGSDTMGNAAANRVPALTSMGSRSGALSALLTILNIPRMTFTTSDNGGGSLNYDKTTGSVGVTGGPITVYGGGLTSTATNSAADHSHTGAVGTVTPSAVSRLQPSGAMCFFVKL